MMFIDEGFGTLDAQSRKQAIEVLSQLAGSERLSGNYLPCDRIKRTDRTQTLCHAHGERKRGSLGGIAVEKYENRQECPIGVFDSGSRRNQCAAGTGGTDAERELYLFGDSKNAPYGTKTLEEVQKLTCADAEYLLSRGVKALVVACNTATSAAIRILREKYADMPVIGIEPALKPAVHAGGHPRVLVMATPMTLREEKVSCPDAAVLSRMPRFSGCRVRGWWSMWSRACWRAQNSKRFLQICLNRTKAIRWIVSCLAARIIRLCGRQSRSFSEPGADL